MDSLVGTAKQITANVNKMRGSFMLQENGLQDLVGNSEQVSGALALTTTNAKKFSLPNKWQR